MQDAVNLGWKLAQVVKGISPDGLLDTYHAERHPAGARALKHTMAQSVVQRADARIEALRDLFAELLAIDGPRKQVAGLVSGLDVAYDLGEGHPLLGRRMPDLDLVTADGPIRVFTLLHEARPVLLNLGEPGGLDLAAVGRPGAGGRRDVRRRLGAAGDRRGRRSAAVLIRPDGHVAWVGEGTRRG